MTSREAILGRIRAAHREDTPHPEVKMYEVPGDALANFERKLRGFDGQSMRFGSRAEALEWLGSKINVGEQVIFSLLPDFKGNISAEELADPHAANVVQVCVGEGELGVGETGSVWVTDRSLGIVAAALFCTDLYLLLDSRKIVGGLHEAYKSVGFGSTHYGAFYTGPSATADIEAVHITGAQGEISLTVLLY